MKKLKIILLIAIISFIAIGTIAEIMDSRFWIGGTSIRDDYDSAKTRFNKEIARDNGNTELFDVVSPLTWGATGLSVGASMDSMMFNDIGLHADTTIGEEGFQKTYTLKRGNRTTNYYNMFDSTVLIWFYNNSRWSTTAQWYAINTYQQHSNLATVNTLTTSQVAYQTYTLPHPGTWRVEVFFVYEFTVDSIINYGTEDSICIYIDYEEPATRGLWIKRVFNPYNTMWGEKGTGYTSIITTELTGGVYGICTSNATSGDGVVARKLYNIRLNYELIQ